MLKVERRLLRNHTFYCTNCYPISYLSDCTLTTATPVCCFAFTRYAILQSNTISQQVVITYYCRVQAFTISYVSLYYNCYPIIYRQLESISVNNSNSYACKRKKAVYTKKELKCSIQYTTSAKHIPTFRLKRLLLNKF